MIVVLKPGCAPEARDSLVSWLTSRGLEAHVSVSGERTVIGLIGDVEALDCDLLRSLDTVESVARVSDPFKSANRRFHPDDTVVDMGGALVGGGNFALIAGPCSVESREQICSIAAAVKAAGASVLRGGAYKPRTSPYDFQGLHAEGIKLLLEAKRETGMPIVTEITSASHLPLFEDVDVIQVGARNMQNFELLRELGHTDKPILLKRGLANTLRELLMSAEYVMSGGNERVILCERGIRTFETYTRNTLDLSAVPALHELTHLPVLVDPSHATGSAKLVPSMAVAAAAAGADGLLIEVHGDPQNALCDGAQSILPSQFEKLARDVSLVRDALKETL